MNRSRPTTLASPGAARSLLAAGCALLASLAGAQTQLYVHPEGNDAWTGTTSSFQGGAGQRLVGPKRTLEGARDEIRALRTANQLHALGAVVNVMPGRYVRTTSFALTAQDSGTVNGPIVYKAATTHQAVLDGGLPVYRWQRANLRRELKSNDPRLGRVVVFKSKLPFSGVTNWGAMGPRSYSVHSELPSEATLYFNGEPMTRSRWPNTGYQVVTGAASDNVAGSPSFHGDLSGMRTPSGTPNLWMEGSLTDRRYAHFVEPIQSLDREGNKIKISANRPNAMDGARQVGPNQDDPLRQGRFWIANSPYEIDMRGEYFINEATGWVYFYPPSDTAFAAGQRDSRRRRRTDSYRPNDVVISMLRAPMATMDSVSHVRFEGLVFEHGRQDGVIVSNGDSVDLVGLVIRNVNGTAIKVDGGRDCLVRSSQLYNLGEGGVYVNGGVRLTLTPSGHEVLNNDIHHFGLRMRFYRPGVRVGEKYGSPLGVGIRVANNTIHDAYHAGIIFDGNLNVIEDNELYDLVTDSGDAAAIYGYTDWSSWGNVIRRNYIHNVDDRVVTHTKAMAIYLDGCRSGVTIRDNVFKNIKWGVNTGTGHYNKVLNNVFIDSRYCVLASTYSTDTDMSFHTDMASQFPYATAPWSTSFPELVDVMTNGNPGPARGGQMINNVHLRCEADIIGPMKYRPDQFERRDNLMTNTSPFVDEAALDFRPKSGGPLAGTSYQGFAISDVGHAQDEYIRENPNRTARRYKH